MRTSGEARRLSVLEVWCYASVHTRAGVWLGTACADETGQERQDKWATTSAICRGRRKAGRRAFVHSCIRALCTYLAMYALCHHRPWPTPTAGNNRGGSATERAGGWEGWEGFVNCCLLAWVLTWDGVAGRLARAGMMTGGSGRGSTRYSTAQQPQLSYLCCMYIFRHPVDIYG